MKLKGSSRGTCSTSSTWNEHGRRVAGHSSSWNLAGWLPLKVPRHFFQSLLFARYELCFSWQIENDNPKDVYWKEIYYRLLKIHCDLWQVSRMCVLVFCPAHPFSKYELTFLGQVWISSLNKGDHKSWHIFSCREPGFRKPTVLNQQINSVNDLTSLQPLRCLSRLGWVADNQRWRPSRKQA